MFSVIQVNRIYLIFNPVHFLVDSSDLKHKDRNFFAITARLLQKITGFCKKMPRTASFFCYAEHYMVEKLYFTTIIASITCQ